MAGLVAVLVIGVSATAAGVSADPGHTPKAFAASDSADLRGVDLAVARRAVSARPVEGVLLTNAAVVEDQARAAAAAAVGRAAQAAALRAAAAQQDAARAAAAKARTVTPATPSAPSAPAAPAPSTPAPAGTTGVNWDGIANCETGGNWSMQGSRFSGGLGFANTTWSGFGGGQFAANAGQATREQQIIVAERVYARYGLSGWGCRNYG